MVVALSRVGDALGELAHRDEALDRTVGDRPRRGRGVDADEHLVEAAPPGRARPSITRGPSHTNTPVLVARAAVAQQRAQPFDVGVVVPERRAHARRRCVRDPHTVWVRDASTSRSVQGLAGGGDEGAEGLGLAHREIGEDLAVDVDLGGLQTRR